MEMEPNHQTHTHDEPSGVISCPDLQSTQAFDMDEDESVFRLTYEDRLTFLQALLNPSPPMLVCELQSRNTCSNSVRSSRQAASWARGRFGKQSAQRAQLDKIDP